MRAAPTGCQPLIASGIRTFQACRSSRTPQRAGTTRSNRQASVINRTASGNSKKSAVTVAQPTSARLLVIQSNQASQISSTPGGERGEHDHLATENAKHGGRHNKQQKQNADKVVSTLVIV